MRCMSYWGENRPRRKLSSTISWSASCMLRQHRVLPLSQNGDNCIPSCFQVSAFLSPNPRQSVSFAVISGVHTNLGTISSSFRASSPYDGSEKLDQIGQILAFLRLASPSYHFVASAFDMEAGVRTPSKFHKRPLDYILLSCQHKLIQRVGPIGPAFNIQNYRS